MESIPYDKRSGKIWFNGKTVDWADANIHILKSRTSTTQAVCFEGERVYEGEIFKLGEHTERLFHSANRMGINVPFTNRDK
jgi:branched-chain amino acid aminotransferase